MATAFAWPCLPASFSRTASEPTPRTNRRATHRPGRHRTGTGQQEPGPATEAATQAGHGGVGHSHSRALLSAKRPQGHGRYISQPAGGQPRIATHRVVAKPASVAAGHGRKGGSARRTPSRGCVRSMLWATARFSRCLIFRKPRGGRRSHDAASAIITLRSLRTVSRISSDRCRNCWAPLREPRPVRGGHRRLCWCGESG
jgi:hypothetical protein